MRELSIISLFKTLSAFLHFSIVVTFIRIFSSLKKLFAANHRLAIFSKYNTLVQYPHLLMHLTSPHSRLIFRKYPFQAHATLHPYIYCGRQKMFLLELIVMSQSSFMSANFSLGLLRSTSVTSVASF